VLKALRTLSLHTRFAEPLENGHILGTHLQRCHNLPRETELRLETVMSFMLRVENLSIRLGEFDLRDISFEVCDGEYFVLLGPTGTGKTVLIECIAGLHRPRTGRIILNGRNVTDLPPEEWGI